MSGYTIRKVSELAAEYGDEFVNSVTNSFSCRYKVISGAELLAFAINHIRRAQDEVGGQIVFLEMEHDNSKLKTFCGNAGYNWFDLLA